MVLEVSGCDELSAWMLPARHGSPGSCYPLMSRSWLTYCTEEGKRRNSGQKQFRLTATCKAKLNRRRDRLDGECAAVGA